MPDPERVLQVPGVERPRQVGQLDASIAHRPRASEACGCHACAGRLVILEEVVHHIVQRVVVVGWILVVANGLQPAALEPVQRQVDLRTADIASQDHR